MDAKLDAYRARKRRQAAVETVKSTLFNMIPLFQRQQQPESEQQQTNGEGQQPTEDHVSNADTSKSPADLPPKPHPSKAASVPVVHKPKPNRAASDGDDDVDDTVLPFSDSESDCEAAAAAAAQRQRAAKPPADMLTYLTYAAYFLLWATCYAIAIELQFGTVYLLVSAIAGVYLNTRTGPRKAREVSAYSVFNADCKAIDGTLDASQFEREIRYGPAGVR